MSANGGVDAEEAGLKRSPSTSSMNSKSSKTSKSSKSSKSSLTSKLSGLLGKPHFSFSMRAGPRSTTASVAQLVECVAGDTCETVSLVTVRKEESIESDVLTELQIGMVLKVVQVGEGRRIKVATTYKGANIEGWISSKTKLNEPLVMKSRNDISSCIAEFEVGGQHEVKSPITVREDEGLDSAMKTELKVGTIIRILEIGNQNTRRARISSETVEGWISTVTKHGELLIGKVEDGTSQGGGSSGLFGASSSKIKVLLENCRCGNLAEVKKVVEGTGGIVSKFSSRPNLNASDIRGKTPLIYASAFGNKDVVEYLLTKSREVDVNAADDTQKTALHHACKRARARRQDSGEVQAEIVTMLLHSGAFLEARDHNGCTALMFSVANGDESVTKRLLVAQANVNIKDFEGHMPLDYAKNFGHKEMCTLLVNAGALCADSDEEEEDDEPQSPAKSQEVAEVAEVAEPASPAASPTAAGGDSPEPKRATGKKKTAGKKEAGAGEKKKAKAKAGKKAAAGDAKKGGKKLGVKGGGMAVKPTASNAMMEALDDGGDEGGKEVQLEEVAKEEEDEKTRALRKVGIVMDSDSAPKELEAAIMQAQAAGASEAEIAEAQKKVKELKGRQGDLMALRVAMQEKDVAELKEVIPRAEKSGVAKAEIEKAKKVLKEETPKQEARDALRAAQGSGDAKSMKDAIAKAKKVGLSTEEIKSFEELLAGAESKEKAEKALKEAMASKDVPALKFAIQQAKDAGLDQGQIGSAEAVLKEEEPKAKAREQMEEALASMDVAKLKAALATAKSAGLGADEWGELEEAIKQKAEQERLLKQVNAVMEESMSCDMKDEDSVREARDKLKEAISSAIAMGVSENDLFDAEVRRKKLHNTIEDLKGAIRVFCRIRPLNKREEGLGDHMITKQTDPMTLKVGDNGEHTFNFDAVFTPGTQEQIFEDCRDLVQSAVDGYNVTLFAYGQTGAGKTFTMAGVPGMLGVSPRTIAEIFQVIEQGKARTTYTVMGSMLELYRQDLVDLLAKGDPTKQKQKLQVRIDKCGMVSVEHLTSEQCDSAAELEDLLERGTKNRATAATAMNSESSRSHLVLMVQIVGVNRETGDKTMGKILIVDLAGSERLKKSQTTADMQKESIEINKSLTALGDVIEALTKGSKVIPYRNHKLTQLMQDALGGTAKTLMFVNCSPASSNEDETLMSLKYAVRAKKITNKR